MRDQWFRKEVMEPVYKKKHCATIIDVLYNADKPLRFKEIRERYEKIAGIRPKDTVLNRQLNDFLVSKMNVVNRRMNVVNKRTGEERPVYSLHTDFRTQITSRMGGEFSGFHRKAMRNERDNAFWECDGNVAIADDAKQYDVRPSKLKQLLTGNNSIEEDIKKIVRKMEYALEGDKTNVYGARILITVKKRHEEKPEKVKGRRQSA